MPQLNPAAGAPAIQLVGPEMSKEELQELYLEVYKLHRLPGSPPGEPALLEEVLSSLEDHQGWKAEEAPPATVRLCPEDPHSSRSSVPQKGKKESLVERSLATVCEAHQKGLAMAATLEEEIERLSCSQNHPETRARSKSRDCQGWSREEWKRRHHQVWFEDPPAPNHPTDPKTGSGEEGATGEDSDLEKPLELRLEVASFMRGSPETSGDEGNVIPLEPTVLEFSQWVPWRAKKCEIPDWWSKLSVVPGMEDYRKLAREVWASFQLPQWMQELGMKEANLQTPPTPPCLGRCRFVPQEKVVAYARGLQHWVEEINPPAGGGQCLLAEGIKELREEVKWYLSFSNEEVF